MRISVLKDDKATWAGCMRASEHIWDLICITYHPGDNRARTVAPTITYAEIIARHLHMEVPKSVQDGDTT